MILRENVRRSDELKKLFHDLISKYEMSFAVVDLKSEQPELFGYNLDHFIYPASVYKIFIGAEVLRRIEQGDFSLEQKITVKSPNDVDKDARLFPGDTRKLLSAGDEVTIDYLLDLMLTRSDNTASNCLIDLVGRESITENIIHRYGWQGSEVTRKFLDRVKEDKPYQYSQTTMSCARHIAEFFSLVAKNELISLFVSQKLKDYMSRWNSNGKKGLAINEYQSYYCKGGWLETNLYNHNLFSLFKAIIKKGWAIIRWSHDAGVVTGEKSHYVVVVMTITKTINPKSMFPMERMAKQIFDYMEQ